MAGSNLGIGGTPVYPLYVSRTVSNAYPATYGYLNSGAPTGRVTSGSNTS